MGNHMGLEVLTHQDDGTPFDIPESRDDSQQWVSAGQTRNWVLDDPPKRQLRKRHPTSQRSMSRGAANHDTV